MREILRNTDAKQESPVERVVTYDFVAKLQADPLTLPVLYSDILAIVGELARESTDTYIKADQEKKFVDILINEHPLPDLLLLFNPEAQDKYTEAFTAQNDHLDEGVASLVLEDKSVAQKYIADLSDHSKAYALSKASDIYKGILDGYYTEHAFFGELTSHAMDNASIDHQKHVCDTIIRKLKPQP